MMALLAPEPAFPFPFPPVSLTGTLAMANTLVQDLIEAGIHFGQRASAWNPRMQQFIYGKRNGIHIIDIKETVKGLLLAKKFIARTVSEGRDVCFVGTKRQAKEVVRQRASDVGMPYVIERWLGGTLTNFRTIRNRLKRLEELEAIEQADNFASYSKKMESQLRREKNKIQRNLEGIRRMDKLPGAVVIIDVRRETTALKEARKLGVPTIALIDSDGDPDLVDIPIPGNDDSMRSIDVVIRELCLAVADGKQQRQASPGGREEAERAASAAGEGDQRRRSRRAQFRAEGAGEPEAPEPETRTAAEREAAEAGAGRAH
jgi:small subunit ribosomal protein S2